MTTMRAVPVLALALAAHASCASAPPARTASARGDGGRECVNTREINAMSPLDDRHVFVRAGAGNNYLFTMDTECPGLEKARRLAVWEAATRVCGDGVSILAFDEPMTGPMRCRIATIVPVRDKNAALDKIAEEPPPQ